MNKKSYFKGIRDGIPIALGYIAVAFTLGIAAKNAGLTALQSTVMSITNITSAGEFAALGLIASGATLLEMAATQLIINLRYCIMSCALSQRLDPKAPFWHRLLIAFGITDEIFGLSICAGQNLTPFYIYGVMSIAIPGWALGTCLGTLSGNLLPAGLLRAMSIAIYGMFIAIIVPPCKKNRILAVLITVSMAASAGFTFLPGPARLSPGFRIIILTVVISGIAAVLFPIKENSGEENHDVL